MNATSVEEIFASRVMIAEDLEVPTADLVLTPRLSEAYPGQYLYGTKHESVDRFYYVASFAEYGGDLSGYLTREEFDWVAERLGTPKLAGVRRV